MLIAQTLLSACASSPHQGAGRDFLGNVYPPQCADLSGVTASIIETSEDEVILWEHGRGSGNYGGWMGDGVIVIAHGLDPKTKAEVIRHEKCHQRMFELTGSAEWHD